MNTFKLEPADFLAKPKVGDIATGRKLGKRNGHTYIWLACAKCGRERWVTKEYFDKRGYSILCQACYNKELGDRHRGISRSLPGNKIKSSAGYIFVKLSPDDFFYPMANKRGYVQEHRLVMAKHLGRCLLPFPLEIVHHKDGIHDHNDQSNLELTSSGEHSILHTRGYEAGFRKGFTDGRSKKIQALEQQIDLSKSRLKSMEVQYGVLS